MKCAPVLTIAGSDSSGGAGIQADLKTITMLGGYGMSAITALTAQNTMGVYGISPVSPEFLQQQLTAVFTDIPPVAVKIGMVYDAPQIAVIAETLKKYQPAYVVLDPVMVSTSGNTLLKDKALDALREQLFPLASLITPNIPEAEVLTEMKLSTSEELETAARILGETYHTAILLKGGHSPMHCNDFLYAEGKGTWILGERIHTKNTHGTGCTLSSAIATALAQGYNLQDSVKRGKDYITHALQAGLTLGHGNGPIAHKNSFS